MDNFGFTKCLHKNKSHLITKYLETAKIKKHSETIGLHNNLASRVLAYDHRIHTASRDTHLHHRREYIEFNNLFYNQKQR
eukprot:1460050-Amphidinium_carterae.1